MRVLLVSYGFPPDTVGGVERYTESLASELVKAGDTVSIVARRREAGRANIRLVCECLANGTQVYRVVGPDIRIDQFLDNHEQLERLFSVALLKARPDVVHINHVMGFSPRIVQMSQQMGAAVVLSLHDFYFACPRIHLQKTWGQVCEGPDLGRECARTCFLATSPDSGTMWGLRTMYFARALEMAQSVIAYSEYVASYFRNFSGQSKPIHIIANGVPAEFASHVEFGPRDNGSASLRIAYCGTVARHKGPHVILEALRMAGLGPVDVLFIGHAPEREYVQMLRDRAASVSGLALKLYGKYERRELPVLLRGADCVVVPSLTPEAGPIVPREALACGVPVVAARIGALPEVIVEGENGFTYDPARPEELSAILRRIANDRELLRHLAAGARSSPLSTQSDHAGKVKDIYIDAVRNFELGPVHAWRSAELGFMHESLLRLGFDSTIQSFKSQSKGHFA